MDRELDVLARTVYGEARGESALGKLAVAYVIVNRANRGGWWGNDIIEVCLCPSQFSMWNTSDPNRIEAMWASMRNADFVECYRAAILAATGVEQDPTEGADHYHNLTVSPSWAEGRDYRTIGHHRFYKREG